MGQNVDKIIQQFWIHTTALHGTWRKYENM